MLIELLGFHAEMPEVSAAQTIQAQRGMRCCWGSAARWEPSSRGDGAGGVAGDSAWRICLTSIA